MEQFRSFVQNSSMKKLNDYCKYFVTKTTTNKSVQSNEQQLIPNLFQQIFKLKNLTSNSFQTTDECTNMLLLLSNSTNENGSIIDSHLSVKISKYSKSLIVFISLIAFVSLVSIIGNLCLAKVLYKKRHRLIQTDRIVLCLALSKFNQRNPSAYWFSLFFSSRWTLPSYNWYANWNLSFIISDIYARMALPFSYIFRSLIFIVYHILSSTR